MSVRTAFRHVPLNHGLRPFYRSLASLVAVILVGYGFLAVLFGATASTVLGLTTNQVAGAVFIAIGAIVLIGLAVGRNIDHWAALLGGISLIVIGLVQMGLMTTDANVLNFTMRDCISVFIGGVVLISGGLYMGTGSTDDATEREYERFGPRPNGHG